MEDQEVYVKMTLKWIVGKQVMRMVGHITGPGLCPLGGGGGAMVLVMVNLTTAVLYNDFHNIYYFVLKKEMLLFVHYCYTAEWISVKRYDEMIHKLSFSFCRLISHWQNLREIWN
jgi:hypothetical protein